MGAHTMEMTGTNFQTEVLDATIPVLVDFWAEWCGPCKMLAPIVEGIAAEHTGRIKVGKLNADIYSDIPEQYQVMGLPTLLLFKNGKVVARIVGYQSKERIIRQLQPHW